MSHWHVHDTLQKEQTSDKSVATYSSLVATVVTSLLVTSRGIVDNERDADGAGETRSARAEKRDSARLRSLRSPRYSRSLPIESPYVTSYG